MEATHYWLKDDKSFWDISGTTGLVTITWSKNIYNDLIDLSKSFFNAAYQVCNEIINSPRSNIKYDMWFLPSVYLFRHSIELLLKAGLAGIITYKPSLQGLFICAKHSLISLFNEYINKKEIEHAENEKLSWVCSYLISIEDVDSNSDLFRYPFNDDFIQRYGNNHLNVVDMGNRLLQCYEILLEIITGDADNVMEIYMDSEPEFLVFASHGIGNCSLWDSPWGDGFHKQVKGYSEASQYLFGLLGDNIDKEHIYPILFLLRNAIELSLKRMLYIKTDERVPDHIISRVRNSHELYKDLWKRIKPIISHYSSETAESNEINIAEKYIKEINLVDKNGDAFRYPFTFSFEYKLNNVKMDIHNVLSWLLGLFNFLDSCNYMFGEIEDYENEMRSYYW